MPKRLFAHYKFAIIFYALLLVYSGYCIGRLYGFTYYPDEFGYWTYAARMAGYDWSDIASLGSYYSYGYSLVLFPIFKIFTDAVTAYRIAVGLNFVLIGVSYIIIAWLGRKLLKLGSDESYIMAAVAAFYPPLLFYAKTTMVETLLYSMFIIICALVYIYIDNNKTGVLVALIAMLVYIHFLHMRAVGVLVAGIITILAYKVRNMSRLRNLIISLIGLAVVILIGFAIKDWVQAIMYGSNKGLVSGNDYSGQINKVKSLFTSEGLLNFTESLSGKILYMGLATYGTSLFGIGYCIKKCFKIKDDKHNLVYLFILLSTVFELLINAIYTIRSYRVDGVTYGRYHEFVFPILIMLGIYGLLNTAKPLLKTIAIILLQLPLNLMAIHHIERYDLTMFRGYFISGISLLYGIGDNSPVSFMWKAYISGSILTLITVILVLAPRNWKKYSKLLIYGLVAIELIYVARISNVYTDGFELATYRDMTIANKILELRSEDDTRRILYIPSGDEQYISILQFAMREEDIEILDSRKSLSDYDMDEIGENDILVLFYENPYIQEASELYNCGLLNGRFYIYYNK